MERQIWEEGGLLPELGCRLNLLSMLVLLGSHSPCDGC